MTDHPDTGHATYGDIAQSHDTWGDVIAAHDTYADLATHTQKD